MNRKTTSLIIGLVIGIVLFVTWFLTLDAASLYSAIKQIRISYIFIIGIFYVLAYFIRSIRWNMLIRKQVKLTIMESWLISAAGNWINYLIPIRAGEVVKALMIKRVKQTSAVSVMPSIFIDKFFDTLGIFFVLIMMPFLRINVSQGLRILILLLIGIFVLFFSLLIIAAVNKSRITSILHKVFFWLPISIKQKIQNLITVFIDGLNVFEHHFSIIVYAVLLTAIGIFIDGLYFYFVFKAFNCNINFLIVLYGYTLINLSYALPQPPAQLGSNEWMMIIIFSMGFGLTKNMASAIMVFAHIYTACIISILGIIGFSYAGFTSIAQVKKELK